MPSKPRNIRLPNSSAKPANATAPLANSAKPASEPATTVAAATAKPATATAAVKPVSTKPAADKPVTAVSGGGYVNRAATKPQNYGADHQSDRDNAYLRFYASFLRGHKPDHVVTYAEIVERQRPAGMRNPLPGAGGKNGCIDRGILSRFDKFGHTVNVVDPADKSRRLGFRFTDNALKLAAVTAGMRDVYTDGKPVAVRD